MRWNIPEKFGLKLQPGLKHARVKVDDAKGKGPVDADPTQNDLPLPPRSSCGLKRKQDEDDVDGENEHQGEDEYEDEEEVFIVPL